MCSTAAATFGVELDTITVPASGRDDHDELAKLAEQVGAKE